MNIKENLNIKLMELTDELNKYINDLKDIFSNYGFEVKSDELKPFTASALLYDATTYRPTERIIRDIDLLNFLLNNEEGYKLRSLKKKDYYTINLFQAIDYTCFLQKKILKDIKDFIEYTSPHTNIDLSTLKISQLSINEWYEILKGIESSIEKDKEIQIIEYTLKFSIANGFITNQINKKGTNAISNANLAFIYDLLYYIKNKNRDNNTLNQKEKSDYIRHRLKKIPWEKIMGENQNISQKSNPKASNSL